MAARLSAATTCVFGGAFDPVHIGHLHIALRCIKAYSISRFIWVPTFIPPHKDCPSASFHHRTAMLKQICSGYGEQLVSEVEASLTPPSFTFNTIKMLKQEFGPAGQWHILIGADNWLTFREWHKPDNLLQEVKIIVYPRPGYTVSSLPEGVSLMRDSVSPYNSTTIRKQLAQGKPVENIGVPPSIKAYIEKHRLYGYGEKMRQQNNGGYSWGGEEALGH